MRRVAQHSVDEIDDVEKMELVSPREKLDNTRDGNQEYWKKLLVKLLVIGLLTASLTALQLLLTEDQEKNDVEEVDEASLGNAALQDGVAKQVPWEEGKANSQGNIAWWKTNQIRSKRGWSPKQSGANISSKNKYRHRGGASTFGTTSRHKGEPGANPSPPEMWSKFDNHFCIKQDEDVDDTEEDGLSRAPRAILLGAMKGGTSSLSTYIREHPMFHKPQKKEMHFFDYNFDDFLTENGILYKKARKEYSEWFHQEGLSDSSSMLALDDSPRYLFWSDRVPQRVMCVAPHAKLLVVVRDPIERSYSNYNHLLKHIHRNPPSFDELVQLDLKQLRQSGVLQDWDNVNFETFSGSQAEKEAWNNYVRAGNRHKYIVGRSLYSLQLQQWFDVMDESGKPRSDMMIVQSELLKTETDEQMSKIWKFLGVDGIAVPNKDYKNVGSYRAPMRNETRDELRKLFHPYNQRLHGMLGAEWEGVWD